MGFLALGAFVCAIVCLVLGKWAGFGILLGFAAAAFGVHLLLNWLRDEGRRRTGERPLAGP